MFMSFYPWRGYGKETLAWNGLKLRENTVKNEVLH